MGGVNKNIRRKNKILKALPDMSNIFTTHDMAVITGMSPSRCSNLLKQFEEIESIGRESGMKCGSWSKIEGK